VNKLISRAVPVCCALLFCASCGNQNNSAHDVEAVKQQIAKYTVAVDAADSALGGQVWLTSPDVSFIWPLGHAHGWEELKKVYEFFAAGFTDRKLTARDIAVHVYKDSAWAEFYWHFTAKQKSNGMEIMTDGRESQVYQKVDGTWRLVHAHYSGPAITPPQ
jgi:ketosteroid isomerase-like protein